MKHRSELILIAAILLVAQAVAVAAPTTDQAVQSQAVSIVYPAGLDQSHVGHPVYVDRYVPYRPMDFGPSNPTNTSSFVAYTSPAVMALEAGGVPYVVVNVTSQYNSTGTVVKLNIPPLEVNGSYMTKRHMAIQYGANGTSVPFWIDSYRGNLDRNNESNMVYIKANLKAGNTTFLVFWNDTSQPGVNDGSTVFKYITGYSQLTQDQFVAIYNGTTYNTLESNVTYVYNVSNWSRGRDPSPSGDGVSQFVPDVRLNKTGVYECRLLFVNSSLSSNGYYKTVRISPGIKDSFTGTNVSGSPYVLGVIDLHNPNQSGSLSSKTINAWNAEISAQPVSANSTTLVFSQTVDPGNSSSNQTIMRSTATTKMNQFNIWASNGVYPESYVNYVLIYNSTPNVTYTVSTNSSVPVTSISVNGYNTIRTGNEYYYYATVAPTLAKQQVTWSVNNTSVATIDANSGLLRPVSRGTVSVTATATDGTGITGSMVITVQEPYTVTVSQPAGGTVSVSSASVFEGDSVTVSSSSIAGYALSSINVTDDIGNTVPVVGNSWFTMPASNVTVTGVFSPVDYSVTVMQSPGGAVSAVPAGGHAGQIITLMANPDPGHEIVSFTVLTENGTPVQVNDNTFTLPTANVSVTPVFGQTSYNVTVTQTPYGSISVSPTSAHAGDIITITNDPDVGYMLETYNVSWQGGTINVRNNTFAMPVGDVTVTGSFMMSVPVPQISLQNGSNLPIGTQTINFTANTTNESYLFLWQTSYDAFETIAESGFIRAGAGSFTVTTTRTGVMQIRMSPADVMYFTTVVVNVYDRLSDFENLSYDNVFSAYFTADHNLSGWDILKIPQAYYYDTVTPFVFWTILFAIVYAALYITTGGAFIPAAAFSAVGFILVNVMPLELSVWARVLISIGLFVVPAYKYFKQ